MEGLEPRLLLATFIVDTTGDLPDANPGDGIAEDVNGDTSLRAALQEANAFGTAFTVDEIHFSIGGGGAQTIVLGSLLPQTIQPVKIDATTQPGYAGSPLITLDGSALSDRGLELNNSTSSIASEVRGLILDDFGGIGIIVRDDNAVIAGNHILSSGSAGISIQTTAQGTSILNNFISGSASNGISIVGPNPTANTVIRGNTISGGDASGIAISNASIITIGGVLPGQGNTIINNGLFTSQDGVTVNSGQRISIRGNSIDNNLGLGIDLANNGVTLNDAGDGDSGANNLQNFPVITFAGSDEVGTTEVEGTIDTQAGTYDLDFYSVTTPDPSGHGEGPVYLGSGQVTLAATGVESFSVTLSTPVPVGGIVVATATDSNGNTSEFSVSDSGTNPAIVVVPLNDPPTADAGGPYSVTEGGTVVLDGSGSTDPDQPAGTLTYEWDLDDDGVFGETGANAELGDEVGINPTFNAAGLDGPVTRDIHLRVTDDGLLFDEDSTTVQVDNAAPVVDPIDGPAFGVPNQTLTFTGSFSDPGVDDTHTLEWEVLDSGSAVVASGSGASFDFVPTFNDTFTVTFTVTDDDGDGDSDSTSLVVATAGLAPDPVRPGQTMLLVGGGAGGESIDIKPGSGGNIKVVVSGGFTEEFAVPDRIVVFGGPGDDDIKVFKNVGAIPAELYGGDGDDKLRGGEGDDILVGGDGDDVTDGNDGRDILIGGLGADKIVGDDEDDILVGGVYVDAGPRAAMAAILDEWISLNSYEDRVANIMAGVGPGGIYALNTGTVFDDGVKDKLKGKKGRDWFLADPDDDKLDIDDDEEILTTIELLFVSTD